jgi:hypothetical protein
MYSGLEVEEESANPGTSQDNQNEGSSNPDPLKKSRKGSRIKTIVKTKVKKKVQDEP